MNTPRILQHPAFFTQKTVIKSAVRELTSPIADYATINTIIQDVLDDNPWGCTAYESDGVSHLPVESTKEGYSATIVCTKTLRRRPSEQSRS